jgi:hypothetical protein
MSVPLDRLYNYIENIVTEITDNIIIYRFFPHGSKKATDLTPYKNYSWHQFHSFPEIICNDQEPLNYLLYENLPANCLFHDAAKKHGIEYKVYNNFRKSYNIHDKAILLHSEQRSYNLEKYKNSEFIPAYYWSHAMISLDWFRYANHLTQQKQTQKTFLIYNRAWSGTREYRLYFSQLLIELNLQNHCKTSINSIEPELGIHYKLHNFSNPVWRPTQVLENHFPENTATSHYSADFDIEDYETTDIEVVLETLFDDGRLHLTEKSLRPIACGQPFMLASTHGSLKYLRSYGFKTFGSVWDEYYDCIKDPQERLVHIATTMRHIANWTPEQRADKMAQAQAISDYNKKHFFSQEFHTHITEELKNNLTSALTELENTNTSKRYIDRRKQFSKVDYLREIMTGPGLEDKSRNHTSQPQRTRKTIAIVIAKARQYYLRNTKE